ncbi:MAG: hypothetical protein VYA53_03930 [Acidobacteriota bacterium]|jgi:uncharacterized Zn finger protein (UPF0148 family)|nr:hypothetical protein [Acidobacteriota bacterium]
MAKKMDRIEVVCPICDANMVVDPKTGLVLHSEKQKPDYSFEDALDQVKTRKEKSDERFEKTFQDERKRREALEDKFREALESKDELDEPPNPFGID